MFYQHLYDDAEVLLQIARQFKPSDLDVLQSFIQLHERKIRALQRGQEERTTSALQRLRDARWAGNLPLRSQEEMAKGEEERKHLTTKLEQKRIEYEQHKQSTDSNTAMAEQEVKESDQLEDEIGKQRQEIEAMLGHKNQPK